MSFSGMSSIMAMRDGSDAIADWPILNALLNTASGVAQLDPNWLLLARSLFFREGAA